MTDFRLHSGTLRRIFGIHRGTVSKTRLSRIDRATGRASIGRSLNVRRYCCAMSCRQANRCRCANSYRCAMSCRQATSSRQAMRCRCTKRCRCAMAISYPLPPRSLCCTSLNRDPRSCLCGSPPRRLERVNPFFTFFNTLNMLIMLVAVGFTPLVYLQVCCSCAVCYSVLKCVAVCSSV